VGLASADEAIERHRAGKHERQSRGGRHRKRLIGQQQPAVPQHAAHIRGRERLFERVVIHEHVRGDDQIETLPRGVLTRPFDDHIHVGRRDVVWALVVALLACILYIATLQPDLGGPEDTPKFQFLGYVFGTAHPPGYPLYIAAGKLAHLAIANHAAALTLVSSLSGAAVASMFYLLDRRQNNWPVALCATLIMALSPLYWLQLTDMFAMVFVLAFLLVEGTSPATSRGDLARRIACGVIAGLALGARPHIAFLIVIYWCIRAVSSRSVDATHVLTAAIAVLAGAVAWLIPASLATGGMETYLHATVGQFEWCWARR